MSDRLSIGLSILVAFLAAIIVWREISRRRIIAHTQSEFMRGTWEATPEFCEEADIDYMFFQFEDIKPGHPAAKARTAILAISDAFTGPITVHCGNTTGDCSVFSFTAKAEGKDYNNTTWPENIKFNYDVGTGRLLVTGVGKDKTCYAEFRK